MGLNPRIRMELEGLGEQLTAMVMLHADETAEAVKAGVKSATEKLDIPAIAELQAKIAITEAVTAAIDNYFQFGDGRKVIDRMVGEAVNTIGKPSEAISNLGKKKPHV